MRSTHPLAALSLVSLLTVCACGEPPGADLVVRNARVYTANDAQPWARAVAVEDGRISFVGDAGSLDAHLSSRTRVVDAGGRLVLPGLIDAHLHPHLWAILADYCALRSAKSLEEILALTQSCAESQPEGWVRGFGWRTSLFGGEMPTRRMLDARFPDRPVVLVSHHMHDWWLNSKALERTGLGPELEDPPGGVVYRMDDSRELRGVFEDAAVDLVVDTIRDELMTSTWSYLSHLRSLFRTMTTLGYVGFMDALVDGEDELRAYWLLDRLGMLPLKGSLALRVAPRQGEERLAEIRRLRGDYHSERLRLDVAKIFLDGNVASKLAFLKEPYLGTGGRGRPYFSQADLERLIAHFDREDFSTHIHVLGDASVALALDAFEAVRARQPLRRRHALAHLQLVDEADRPRLAALGILANVSPSWAYHERSDPGIPFFMEWNERIVGPRMLQAGLYLPLRSLRDAETRLVASTDFPFMTLDPFEAIETGVTRRHPEQPHSPAYLPEEALDLETLLRAFTIHAAHQLHREREMGSIEVGKAADLIILDRDLFEIPAEEISDTRVLLTLIDGEIVHEEMPSPLP